jgi:dCMP deaminase
MERLNLEEYACFLAFAASSRSEDPFTQVGACLLDVDGNVLGTGTNGLAPKMLLPPEFLKEENRARKSELMLHAETNLFNRRKDGHEYLLGLTISPCFSCAKFIAGTRIKKVVFLKEYERGDGKYKDVFSFYQIEYKELNTISKNKIKRKLESFNF